jgi:hypothetical protein
LFLAVGWVIGTRRSEALEEKSPPRRGQAKTAIAAVREVQYIRPIGIKAIAMRMLVILLIPLAGCWNTDSPEARRQAALSKLDAMEAVERGDIIRARAECQAIAVEVPSALDDCLGALRIQIEMSQQTLDDIKRRRRELSGN